MIMAPPLGEEDLWDKVTAKVEPAFRFELMIVPHEEGRYVTHKKRPSPKPNLDAIYNLKDSKNKCREERIRRELSVCSIHPQSDAQGREEGLVDDVYWWECWFLYLSKKQLDRDDMRDLILSKLPVSKLYAVGCVPEYFPYLFNAHVNPFLENQLKHNTEYFPSAFCTRLEELDNYGILHDVSPRQVVAYQIAKKKWVKFPTLEFLPPRVNQMLAGEGGLLLMCGDPPPWVDPLAPPEPVAPPPEPPKPEKKNGEGEEDEEAEEEAPEEGDEEDEGPKKKKTKPPPEKPPEKRIDPNGQKLIVVCNPIARTFRILPRMHCHLENLMGHIAVNSISSEYVVYIIGYHPAIGQCPEPEGLRVAVFKSLKGIWRVFSLPQGKLYRPGMSCYNRALPLITKNIDTSTIFCAAQVITPQEGITIPVVLSFRKKMRCFKAYSWPSASEIECPQLVECNGKLYIVARGIGEKTTITIWTFIYYEYSRPECKQITKMPPTLFTKIFPYGYRISNRSNFDLTSSTNTIAFTCRERPTRIGCYNVKKDSWSELPLWPGWIENLTFMGNWRFEPAAHAQV